MEQNKLHCTLTDAELSAKAQYWIDRLIKSGDEFTMHVPARPNEDTDLILSEVVNRFKALQAKCDRYEAALKVAKHALEYSYDVLSYPATGETTQDKAIAVINEALSAGEGEKDIEKPWWEGKVINDMPEYVKITGIGCSIEQGAIVKVEGAGKFEIPTFDNYGQLYVLLRDKHFDKHGLIRMNCKNFVPATEADYNSYLQTTNQNNG